MLKNKTGVFVLLIFVCSSQAGQLSTAIQTAQKFAPAGCAIGAGLYLMNNKKTSRDRTIGFALCALGSVNAYQKLQQYGHTSPGRLLDGIILSSLAAYGMHLATSRKLERDRLICASLSVLSGYYALRSFAHFLQ